MPLAPFAPPYVLGGRSSVMVGFVAKDGVAIPPLPRGFRPVGVGGRLVVVVVATKYERVPEELPIRYHEVIFAIAARRGCELASVPFDMVLDAREPTDLGVLHYGLPKRFDEALSFDLGPRGLRVSAPSVALRADAAGAFVSACLLPVRLLAALGVRLFTSRVDVLGAAHPPPRRARIALEPEGTGRVLRVREATFGGVSMAPVWCQAWRWTTTRLGAPTPAVDRDP